MTTKRSLQEVKEVLDVEGFDVEGIQQGKHWKISTRHRDTGATHRFIAAVTSSDGGRWKQNFRAYVRRTARSMQGENHGKTNA